MQRRMIQQDKKETGEYGNPAYDQAKNTTMNKLRSTKHKYTTYIVRQKGREGS